MDSINAIEPPNEALQVIGLKKRVLGAHFEIVADLKVSPGERLGLVGPSGAGKTVLLRTIAGLESFDEGQVRMGSRDWANVPAHQRDVGFVFQDQVLFPSMNVGENVAFGLRMRGVKREVREGEALSWLERVGLRNRARSSVETLSGGERQRVAFVRALIFKPRLILLDEPFSALDSSARESLSAELLRLHSYWPAPLIVVSHGAIDLEKLATRRLQIHMEGGGALRRVGAIDGDR